MRGKAITILAAGLAITGTFFQAPATAEARTHRVQTVKADVDGDGRADTVKVDRLAKKSHYRTTYRITVKTAAGKKATRTLTVKGSVQTGRIKRPLVGVVALDGSSGSELAIRTSNYARGEFRTTHYQLFTWRAGKLVKEAAPAGSWKTGSSGSEGSSNSYGYVFDEVDGARYRLGSWRTGSFVLVPGAAPVLGSDRSCPLQIRVGKWDKSWEVEPHLLGMLTWMES